MQARLRTDQRFSSASYEGHSEETGGVVAVVAWRRPAWRVVLFCAGVGGLTLA